MVTAGRMAAAAAQPADPTRNSQIPIPMPSAPPTVHPSIQSLSVCICAGVELAPAAMQKTTAVSVAITVQSMAPIATIVRNGFMPVISYHFLPAGESDFGRKICTHGDAAPAG